MNQTNMYTKFYILRLLILSRSESVAGEAIPNVEIIMDYVPGENGRLILKQCYNSLIHYNSLDKCPNERAE